jgi:hypothetical protein
MKKKLLYLTSILLFSASINAQTTVWDFGKSTSSVNDAAATAAWPIDGTGVASTTPVITVQKDLLNLTSHTNGTNFAIVATGSATFTDGYTGSNTLKTGGSGTATSYLPTVRYFSFNVDKACTVKVWFRHGSGSGADRTVFVTGGTSTSLYGSAAAVNTAQIGTPLAANPLSNAIVNASVTAAGIVYVYADNGVSVYKIEVSGATVNTPALATDSFQKESDVVVYANGGKINLSNIKSSTKVEVYSVLGSLIKSAQADADTSLDINSGVYIVKVKSAEGEKSVKVIVQ